MEDGRRREELRRAGNGGWVEEAERLRRAYGGSPIPVPVQG